jgi:hypothetical protein
MGALTIGVDANTTSFEKGMDKTSYVADKAAKKVQASLDSINTHGAITNVTALGGALRGLDGSMNVRAAERFLASFSGIASLAQAAFPVFGLLAVGDILEKMGEKAIAAYKALSTLSEGPQRIASAFRSLNGDVQQSNDSMQVANDRLAMEIAKLEGKPANGLKLALDLAVQSADKLAGSLDKDLVSLNKLLTDNKVPLWAQFLGMAGTGDLQKELSGKNGQGGFTARINSITDTGTDKIRTARDAGKSTDAATKDLNDKLAAAYKDEIGRLTGILTTAQGQQALRASAMSRPSTNADSVLTRPGAHINDQSDLMASTQVALRNVKGQFDSIGLGSTNDALAAKKTGLEDAASATSLTKPFDDATKRLSAELDGLKQKLATVGQPESAQIMSKAYADWRSELTKLNAELAKHHTVLTAAQSEQLKNQFVSIEQTKAESAWKEALDKSTTGIDNKIASYTRLTSAIGQGYQAQRAANIEDQLQAQLGGHATDAHWLKSHASDVNKMRSNIGAEVDASSTNRGDNAADQLSRQIDLQKALTVAEGEGGEAVRLVNLQYELAAIAKTNDAASTEKLIALTAEYASAQNASHRASILTNLQLEIDATNRLTAAQVGGAAAIRAVQLANQIAGINHSSGTDSDHAAQIQLATQAAAAAHQQEIAASATRAGNAYADQLDSLAEMAAYLKKIQTDGDNTLATQMSIEAVEAERLDLYSRLLQSTNSASDGVKAFFLDMQKQAQTAASIMHDALSKAFSDIADQMAKLVVGGKTDFEQMFRGLGEQVAKQTITSVMQKGAGALGKSLGINLPGLSGSGKPDGSAGNPLHVILAGGGNGNGGILGTSGGKGGGIFGGLFGGPGTPQLGGTANLDQDDLDNLGDFGSSDLSKLSGGSGGGFLSSIGGFLSKLFVPHALGGSMTPTNSYLVGEQGPEILSGISGNITSNAQSQRMLINSGGGSGASYYVDARNSDASTINANMNTALTAVHGSAIKSSIQVSQELSRRRPKGSS